MIEFWKEKRTCPNCKTKMLVECKEMRRLNQKVCKPPLSDKEVLAIIKSSLKYEV